MIRFEPGCQEAIDVAKRACPEGAPLEAHHLLRALWRAADLAAAVGPLAERVPPPAPLRPGPPGKARLAEPLQPVFAPFEDRARPVAAAELCAALARSEAGRRFLEDCGLSGDELGDFLRRLDHVPAGGPPPPATPAPAPGSWRSSAQRQEALRALASFGRMLTEGELPAAQLAQREETFREIYETLSKMKRRTAILVGAPGTGKTAIVYELARRLLRDAPELPERLRGADIFELQPAFLRSGASLAGQYEERVKSLLEILRQNPRILLFVDEIHSLLQSGIHERGAFSDANETFKAAIGQGQVTLIGCTTPAEYRRFIEPDGALARRLTPIQLPPPTSDEAVAILRARRARVEAHYAPLQVPDEVLRRAVELTDEYLPARNQPDKAIQLLDEACAACAIRRPPLPAVTEDALLAALEKVVGKGLRLRRTRTFDEVLGALSAQIVGQDPVLHEVAQAFVAGLGSWRKDSRPRGVFLFGGPTGVGKTEAALLLAELVGDGRECLVRIDCNALQGSGHDSGPAIHRLLGVPPGYVGYARGQGGILSRIRDLPDSVVLFDEFEKADPGVGKLLLQVIDEGRLEDVDGNLLDFRRSFVIFTTNAGCVYDRPASMGFASGGQPAAAGPRVDEAALWADLRAVGLGQEFFARIDRVFLFQALESTAIRRLAEAQLERLRTTARGRGLALEWDPALVDHLAAQWEPRFGVRHLSAILRNRITGQIGTAEAQGELDGVVRIRLEAMAPAGGDEAPVGAARRWRSGDTLTIALA